MYMYICIHVYMCKYIYTYTYICICIYICMYICIMYNMYVHVQMCPNSTESRIDMYRLKFLAYFAIGKRLPDINYLLLRIFKGACMCVWCVSCIHTLVCAFVCGWLHLLVCMHSNFLKMFENHPQIHQISLGGQWIEHKIDFTKSLRRERGSRTVCLQESFERVLQCV